VCSVIGHNRLDLFPCARESDSGRPNLLNSGINNLYPGSVGLLSSQLWFDNQVCITGYVVDAPHIFYKTLCLPSAGIIHKYQFPAIIPRNLDFAICPGGER
jgi:hypothetical protein